MSLFAGVSDLSLALTVVAPDTSFDGLQSTLHDLGTNKGDSTGYFLEIALCNFNTGSLVDSFRSGLTVRAGVA